MDTIIRREKDAMPMALVPAGPFLMGIDDEEHGLIYQEFRIDPWNERPQREIYLDSYYIDQFAVSNEQFCSFLNQERDRSFDLLDAVAQVCAFHPASHIEAVSDMAQPRAGCEQYPAIVPWAFARMYAEWIGGSLPSEAQWEKAARGSDGRRFPWGNDFPGLVDYLCNRGPELKEVDACPRGRSPYGCYNMAGNVWDWCLDSYSGDFYARMPETNPLNLEGGDHPAYRGGSYNFRPSYFHRTTCRAIESAEYCGNPVGFRCVRILEK